MLTSHQPLHEGWLARETNRNGLISFHFLFGNHYSFAQRLRRLPTIFPQGFGKFLNRTACVSLSWPLALFAARCVVFFVSQLFHRPSLHGSKESQVSSDQKIRRSGRLYNLKLQHLVGFRTQKPLRWKNTNISGCKVFHFLTNIYRKHDFNIASIGRVWEYIIYIYSCTNLDAISISMNMYVYIYIELSMAWSRHFASCSMSKSPSKQAISDIPYEPFMMPWLPW